MRVAKRTCDVALVRLRGPQIRSGDENAGGRDVSLWSAVSVGVLPDVRGEAGPAQDFVPLVALLRRRLTDAEVSRVAHDLVANGTLPADRVDVGAAIARVTAELPSEDEIERVRAYLADHGWPTDFVV